MDTFIIYLINALKHHFTWGFIAGFIPCVIISYYVWKEKRSLKRQILDLKQYRETHEEIHAGGSKYLQDENKTLKEQNLKLLHNINQLQAKPDGNAKRELFLYQFSVEKMQAEAPGFAVAWINAMQEARQAYDDSSKGVMKFINPIISKLGYNKMPTAAGFISNDQKEP